MGLQVHVAGLVFMCVGLLVWIVALAGLGASTYNCNVNNSKEACAKRYQMEWWTLWFEFFLLVLLIATCPTRHFTKLRQMWSTYLSMVTVLVMISARNFITDSFFSKAGLKKLDYKADAYNCAAAGFVMLGIVNFLLVIFVTVDLNDTDNHSRNVGSSGSVEIPQTQFQTNSV